MAGWAILALAFLALYPVDLRLDYTQLSTACAGSDCNYLALSTAELDVLESWGLSGQFYAVMMIGMSTITVIVYMLLAALVL